MKRYPRIQSEDLFERARVIREKIHKGSNLTIDAWNTVIRLFRTYQEGKEWIQLMEQRGIEPDVFTYNSLINKCRNYPQASSLLYQEMEKRGVKPDVFTYNSLIKKCKNYSQASSLYQEMEKRGVKPDVVTYGSLISKCRNYSQASSFYQEMEK